MNVSWHNTSVIIAVCSWTCTSACTCKRWGQICKQNRYGNFLYEIVYFLYNLYKNFLYNFYTTCIKIYISSILMYEC